MNESNQSVPDFNAVPFSSDKELTIYFVIYCFVTCFVIFSNGIILILLIKEHKRQKRSHRFITSVVVSDLCSGFICILYGYVLFYPTFQQNYLDLCLVKIACTCIFRYNSLLIKLTTAIDRYWAVVHPINYFVYATDNVIRAMIFSTWGLSVLLAIIGIIYRENNVCAFNDLYMSISLHFGIPVILLSTIILCLRIWCALRNRAFIHKLELNATTLLIISITIACVLWIPAMIMYDIYQMNKANYRNMFGYIFFYCAHPIINAFLYGYAIKKRSTKLFY